MTTEEQVEHLYATLFGFAALEAHRTGGCCDGAHAATAADRIRQDKKLIVAAISAAEDAANSAWLETDRERLDDARHAGQAAMRERCAALAKSFIQPPPVPGAIDTRTIHGNSRAEQIEAAILALEVE